MHSYQIGDKHFEIYKASVTKTLLIAKTLGQVLAPVLSKLGGVKSLDDELPTEKIAEAIQAFAATCDDKTYTSLIKDLLSTVKIDNKDVNLERDFADNPFQVFKLLVEVVKVNYISFLGDLMR